MPDNPGLLLMNQGKEGLFCPVKVSRGRLYSHG
jgi:hypothetical protein